MVLDAISHMTGSAVGFPAQWSPAGTGHQCACANGPVTLCRLWEGPREHRGGQTSGDNGPHLVPSHKTAAAGPEPRAAVLWAEPPRRGWKGPLQGGQSRLSSEPPCWGRKRCPVPRGERPGTLAPVPASPSPGPSTWQQLVQGLGVWERGGAGQRPFHSALSPRTQRHPCG